MKNTKLKYKLNFKTMKKGLLTLLAASLVFVGCQNYDDQFDDLNAQISALKSQVDGLSSLSGQVSALSGSISGLQSGIAASASSAQMTALSASLSALQAEVDAIEAAIATTATAAEVTALQASLTAVETDLADLLVSNNVYSTAVTVNSAASMASALALGNKVALMNAAVTITDDATIADTDIQTFIDRIKTMNGAFTYSSGSATGYAATFNELTAATTLDITQAGDISFAKMASATVVTITTSYSTKITSVDMGAMTSVTSIASGADGSESANTLTVSSATNVDLGSLTRYGSSLSITTKKDATLDIASLDDVTAAGAQSDISLTLNGPASVTLSKIDDGTITLSNVAAATVSGFYGTLDINSGVETLTTTDSVTIALDGATDLVTGTLDYKHDWDPTLTTAQAAVADDLSNDGYLEDYAATGDIGGTDLKTLTISGELLDLYLDEANLETLTLSGATIHDLTISNMDDLTTLSVASGNKIGNISLTGSDNLTVANFDHTTNLDSKASGTTASTTVQKAVDFVVTDNLGLTKLHTTGDDVDVFTVTGNDALTELDMTGLKDQGTATSATVNLYDNDLTAVSASNTTDGETNKSDGASGDAGSFDDGTSGMDTMKVYLTAVAADSDNTAQVSFDTVSTETDTETSGTSTVTLNVLGATTSTTTTNEATVLKMVTGTAGTSSGATKAKQAFVLDWKASGDIQLTVNSVALFDTTVGGAGTALTIGTANKDLQIQAIESAVNLSRATAANVTLDAARGYASSGTVSLAFYSSGAATSTLIGQRYSTGTAAAAGVSTTNYGMGVDDLITFTVGSNSVTFSLTGVSETSTAIADIGDGIVTAWANKYGATGTASVSAIATVTDTDGVLTVTMLQTDSAGYGVDIDMSVSGGTVTATNGNNLSWRIGSSDLESDDATTDTDIIVSVESTVAGVDENTISTVATTGAAADKITWVALAASTYTANTTFASTYANQAVNRTDVRTAEDAVSTSGTAATNFSRVAWLG